MSGSFFHPASKLLKSRYSTDRKLVVLSHPPTANSLPSPKATPKPPLAVSTSGSFSHFASELLKSRYSTDRRGVIPFSHPPTANSLPFPKATPKQPLAVSISGSFPTPPPNSSNPDTLQIGDRSLLHHPTHQPQTARHPQRPHPKHSSQSSYHGVFPTGPPNYSNPDTLQIGNWSYYHTHQPQTACHPQRPHPNHPRSLHIRGVSSACSSPTFFCALTSALRYSPKSADLDSMRSSSFLTV